MKKVMLIILLGLLLANPLILASAGQAFFSEEELAQARFGNIMFFTVIGIIILIILIFYVIFKMKNVKKTKKKKTKREKKKQK